MITITALYATHISYSQTLIGKCNYDPSFDKCVSYTHFDQSGCDDIIEYYWMTGDGTRIDGNKLEYCYKEEGTYEAKLYSKSSDGEKKILSKMFPAYGPLTVSITAPEIVSTAQAFKASLTFDTHQSVAIEKVEWYLDDEPKGEEKSILLTIDEPGDYILEIFAKLDLDGYNSILCGISMIEIE